MMGHSSYIVTEKYTHLRDKMLEDAQAKFTTSLLHHTDTNTKQSTAINAMCEN